MYHYVKVSPGHGDHLFPSIPFILTVLIVLLYAGCKDTIIDSGTLIDASVRPAVLSTYPLNNSVGPFENLFSYEGRDNPHFIIAFNKILNRNTVGGAISVKGFDRPAIAWVRYYSSGYENILDFSIVDSLFPYNTSFYQATKKYTVTIDTTYEDINGNHPEGKYSFSFIPEPYFRVVSMTPGNRFFASVSDDNISVIFNSKVTSSISQFITISPPTAGKWMVNKSDSTMITFAPSTTLQYSTNYTVSLTTSARDRYGNQLHDIISERFTTELFTFQYFVVSRDYYGNISPGSDLSFSFSGPIDSGSVRQAFQITPNIPGFFRFSSDNFSFSHTGDFIVGTQYCVTISSALRASNGTHLPKDTTICFLAGPFEITYNYPNAYYYPTNRSALIEFGANAPMDTATARSSFTIDPPTSGKLSYSYDFENGSFYPDTLLTANTTYTVTISTSLKSKGGTSLSSPYTFSFTTGYR